MNKVLRAVSTMMIAGGLLYLFSFITSHRMATEQIS